MRTTLDGHYAAEIVTAADLKVGDLIATPGGYLQTIVEIAHTATSVEITHKWFGDERTLSGDPTASIIRLLPTA